MSPLCVWVCVCVYVLERDSRLQCDDPSHELPKEGKIRDMVGQLKRCVCAGLPPSEMHEKHRSSLAAPLPPHRRAVVIPLLDQEQGVVISVLLVGCKPLSDQDEQHLNTLEKHAAVACRRVRTLQSANQKSLVSLSPIQPHNALLRPDPTYYCDLDRKILQLCGELYDLDATTLQLKVINYLQQQTQSQCCCLLLVSEDNHQLFCQVVGDKVLEEEISFPLMFGRFGQVVEKKRSITLQDVTAEERRQLSSMLGSEVSSLLCVPVVSRATGQVVALACAFNKQGGQRCDTHTCSVFLLDQVSHELVAKVFDGGVVSDDEKEFRIPADQGIAGHVAMTGQILNIKDAYSHPLFYRGVDDSTGFRTRNILCFPIKDENNEVIGVAELVNKTNGPWFNRFDEDLATAFSIYCGISIAHSLLYKKVHEAQFRSHLANEMMMYHMKVSAEEVAQLLVTGLEPVEEIHPLFAEFTYTPRSLPDDNTPMGILSMFEDMGFINAYKIDLHTLARFCLMVKKGYRDPPYHNWTHAFSVSHFCYLLYKNLGLANYLENIEIFALFVSCMCHDLDHRGTNNSFQVASQSVLAALYSSEGSVMERHHFAQAIAILNTHGCNIFDKFSRKDYQRMLDLMRDIILATDLAHHLRIFPDLQRMADAGYNPRNQTHRSLLLCLLMTSCDLSDQTKGWKTTRKIAELIYKEFFSQGDLEKAMGNRPSEMMDREKAYIPELQISFMEHIAMPIYKLLSELLPGATELYERVATNRVQWTKVSHKFSVRGLPSNNSLDFLDEEYELLQSQGALGDDSHCDDTHCLNGCLDEGDGGRGL
ncbi:cGMP-dependent 3',5'-cyclic phosphodiesterase-like [Oncorhynchus kisutch]|uniref:cGMP-dependent 3',5'-cyclic phosphodiesterase-like n=1 Tax=Oncorhynchus kisutch TaxID=8019 RepID=UPI0012DF83FD|nr:cGMP-dependent 3',5'-cyclic phosphodiesterase-like [Oncorhynchus kisutch]